MKKISTFLSRSGAYVVCGALIVFFLAGCVHNKPAETETKKKSTMMDYVQALPHAYFEFYFPVGTSNSSTRAKSVAVNDEEHGYIEFKDKQTVSGTVHWAIKSFATRDGENILVISDLLQNDTVKQHLFVLNKDEKGEWTDQTVSYLNDVMKEIKKLNVEKIIRDHYKDDEEEKKLKNGRFVFSPASTDIVGGVGNVWSVEFPVYIISWNGERFSVQPAGINANAATTSSETNTAQ